MTRPSFINDVVVTRDAAYFTNSQQPELYRVPISPRGEIGSVETIPLAGNGPAGDYVAGFNLNGIDATSDGRTLFVVNSTKGMLYTVDARTGASAAIDLGGATVTTGDGILLVGHDLLVLRNGGADPTANEIAVVRLRDRFAAVRSSTRSRASSSRRPRRWPARATRWSPPTPSSSRRRSTPTRGRAAAALAGQRLCRSALVPGDFEPSDTEPSRVAVPPQRQADGARRQHGGGEHEPDAELLVDLLLDDLARQPLEHVVQLVGVLGAEVLPAGQVGDALQRLLVDLAGSAARRGRPVRPRPAARGRTRRCRPGRRRAGRCCTPAATAPSCRSRWRRPAPGAPPPVRRRPAAGRPRCWRHR